MPIYRGDGGSGDATTDAYASQVAQDAQTASEKATEAAASATAASNSATNAANSATDAAASETAAETAETNAETAETNAAASATAAATSETNAATSETNAATSETNAAASASNASTSATNAANSASAASTSASNAATSESNAATSETNAATSETNAANSATQASTSATNAATSASDAATTYDNFDDRYLGEKTSNPSVDNDGDALITGALYFNSTASQMRVWDGSAWEAAYLPASSYLHLSGGTMTGALELHANPSNNLEAATKQYVDDVAAEGIQYHAPVRVEVEGNLTVTYNNGTAGVGATLTNAGTQAALVIDDITMVVNDRVLIYEQTDATQNGIYTVTDIGSASTNWVLTRATDADSYAPSDPDALAQGSGFFVQEGTLGAGEKYVCNTVGTITFGTTNISFVQVATAQIYTAGTGIYINGSVISNTGLLTTGSTATDLAITSADINGGNIDGTIIGATTPAAATFAAFTSNGIDDNATSTQFTIGVDDAQFFNPALPLSVGLTVGGNTSIRGDLDCDAFTSNGIDDNATSTAITINASDNVGIGETAPTAKLHVQETLTTGTDVTVARFENNSSNLYFRINDASDTNANWELFTGGSEELIFSPGASEKMRINASGTVQVGGDGSGLLQLLGSPSGLEGGQLDIITAGSLGTYSIDAYTDDLRFLNGTTAGNYLFYKNSNAAIGVIVTGTGRIGIGTTGPSFPLDIRAPSGGGDAVLRVHNQFTGSGDDAILRLSIAGTTADSIIQFGDGGDADVGRIAYHHNGNTMRFFVGAAEEMRLLNNGNLHVDGNVIAYSTTISDERLKDDVQDITGALDTVDALRGVTYTWNAGSREGKRDYGLIAQEVEQVIPEIVHDTTMPLLGDEETVYKTVDYEKLCAVLINAVSELRAEVEALKNGSSV